MSHLSLRAVRRASLLAVAACAVAVAPAGASAPHFAIETNVNLTGAVPTGYIHGWGELLTGRGDPRPDDPSDDTMRLDVTRDGTIVATSTERAWTTVRDFAVQAGDVITLTDETTGGVYATTYSGAPTIDGDLCGVATVEGVRDEGADLLIFAKLFYGYGDPRNAGVAAPWVVGPGTSFSAKLPAALDTDWVVTAMQMRSVAPDFDVTDNVTRAVGTCPVEEPEKPADPPAAPAPAPAPAPGPAPAPAPTATPDVVAPTARLGLARGQLAPSAAYRALLGGRFVGRVSVSEAGVVTQKLYADDGAALPRATTAAAAVLARRAPVLGSARVAVSRAGTVAVKLKLSARGKAALKRTRTARVALVTTVTDGAGNTRTLSPKRFAVTRSR